MADVNSTQTPQEALNEILADSCETLCLFQAAERALLSDSDADWDVVWTIRAGIKSAEALLRRLGEIDMSTVA